MNQADFESALQALRDDYRNNLPVRMDELTSAWRLVRDGAWDAEPFTAFARLAHSLAGSGATYGFGDVSRAARALEQYCKACPAEERISSDEQCEIEKLLGQLEQAIALPLDPLAGHLAPEAVPPLPGGAEPLSNKVLLYEPNLEVADDIETQLGFFGYVIERIAHLNALPSDVGRAAALILDWDAAQADPETDPAVVLQLNQAEPALPILFLSAHDDLRARLNAVRHGATAYLVKPISANGLLETLDAQMGYRSSEPFRILIVEDDAALAAWSAQVLEQGGMVTRVVTEPLQVMGTLIDFRPDLVLSDMHMPHVNGLELASILRQQEAYVGIPIVFLSNETDLNKQLHAMLVGGDDFLMKPIPPHHLVASVTSRVQRARILRSLAERDSLTGLLNHTRFKEQVVIELARASRAGRGLAFVMLDIDHFKVVNDTYGHPAGDRVIKSLARLLKQRLRKSDTLGRYGGEEFGVLLPETSGDAALRRLDEIRVAFSQIRQYAGGREFEVTFSGGVATMPPFNEATALSETADRALYQAKRGGRDQIVYARD
ncbi:MAG: diguanylate cyclase [Chloroflexi bacterium]|nr:diguanylate cyclase [Chloroflexota bacterium]